MPSYCELIQSKNQKAIIMSLLRPDIIPIENLKRRIVRLDKPGYDWLFLAEGDSWFSIAAFPSSNLLFEMRFSKWTKVLSLAYPGDTLLHISDLASNGDLRQVLAEQRYAYKFTAMLLSGGGNDIIDRAKDFILPEKQWQSDGSLPEHYIDSIALEKALHEIQLGYKRIVSLRDQQESLSVGAPIFVHTYDYATPRDAPADFLGVFSMIGPWLYKAFEKSGINPVMQQKISDLLMDSLAEKLLDLDCLRPGAKHSLPNFHVIDTRNTLIRANATEEGNSNDWLNEIHPNIDGYRKIAEKISAAVNKILA
jgi:lysophospholipase L1-like esterase